jgi:serine phosphatase RsbU (regulator of sigma subunit)
VRQLKAAAIEDQSELVVALFRTAFLFSLIFARGARTQYSDGPAVWADVVVALACFYNLAILILYWREVHFRAEREITVAVDLVLVTLCVGGTGGIGSPLFPLYYMVVIVGGHWFDLYGGLATAAGASGLYLLVALFDGGAPGLPIHRFLAALVGNVPFLFLIALIVGYMSRAIRAEQRRTARHEQELAMARRIQQDLLSATLPPTPGYDIAYRVEPASEIGGDYFDVMVMGPGRVGICVADVAGRSISAAQHLSLFKFVIHATAPGAQSPVEVAERANELLAPHLQEDMFVAMFFGVLDVPSGRFEYVNAGHTPPLLGTLGSDQYEELTTGGIVLGAVDCPRYKSAERTLRPGHILVMCTDGVETARDQTGEMYGAGRVREALVASATAGARQIADAIVQDVEQFARNERDDDLTVAVVKVTAPEEDTGAAEA